MPRHQTITRSEAIQKIAAELTGRIAFDEFANRVLTLCPSTAKKPMAGIRNELAYGTAKYGFVFLDLQKQMLAPLHIVILGIRFRHIIKKAEAESAVLLLDANWISMLGLEVLQERGSLNELQFLNEKGEPQVARVHKTQHKKQQWGQVVMVESTGYMLTDWYRTYNPQPGDSVLITIEAWPQLCLRLEYEPAAQRNEQAIQARNRELMNILYAMLENASNESLSATDAIFSAHARLANPQGYPGDPWQYAMVVDGRMSSYGFDIRYAKPDDANLFAAHAGVELPHAKDKPQLISTEALQQIYRFHCSLKHRTGLWRMIDIQGKDTLADFNTILVNAFNHDWDHMGGFLKRVRRGNTKKFREIDLGQVDPFGEGEGVRSTNCRIRSRGRR